MAMKIDPDMCTACADCEPECPTVSITEKSGVVTINAATCDECVDEGEPRCVSVCPVDCISPA
ncbi:4Fe-4S binding protein [Oceanospirillum sediminis]|uniref:4Fe-4S binding protein n=1 Tax=Oceanospirillum sediminis TaxID=2760088 RepID=A0A839IQH8_9GAMM|nr:4Fe-4S binding protein [Oceanospirillum sediminis]MBB1486476.1 4Fe-4S binding protein [Oceanospirillum sediminis]